MLCASHRRSGADRSCVVGAPEGFERAAATTRLRLVRQLTIYLLLAIGAVLAVDTALSIQSHLALFEADLRQDQITIGEGLRSSIESSWKTGGAASAHELVQTLAKRETETRVRLVPAEPEMPPGGILQERDEREGGPRFRTLIPLDVKSERPVALEISEPLTHERTYLAKRLRGTLMTATATVFACGLIAWIVGVRLVGRPIQELVSKARRIGAGDFSSPLRLRGRHEISMLAGELNGVADCLDAAAREVAAESTARILALAQLRHADRLTTVGKLASGLAHELGTPLNVIAGRASMIASRELEDASEIQDSARIIGEQAERMTHIVRKLLDFARRQPPEKRRVELASLARTSVEMLEPLAKRRGVELSIDVAAPGVLLLADPGQLQQVLTNIVVNAIQASPSGSSVSIHLREQDVVADSKTGRRAGSHAVLEVIDRGEGIPEESMDSIFDPFFTTKPVGEGTGLGLSVAYAIVEEHSGFIEVESTRNQGSCFRIWLPQESI